MSKKLAVIILAAGKSTRMKSDTPKVLHPLCGRPMLGFVLDLARSLKPAKTVAVLGYKHEEVAKHLGRGVTAVVQKKLCGTADAVKTALTRLTGFRGNILVLYGDTPLLKKDTVDRLLKYHTENNVDVTLLAGQLEKPAGYGRIMRDKYSTVCGIIEDKDTDDFQKQIKEVNTGIMCFDATALVRYIGEIRPNNRKKEYYLTDAIRILYKKGKLVDAVRLSDINEALGINTRQELSKANSIMQSRINEKYMLSGVSIVDPVTTFISWGTRIGIDTVIFPFTVIEKDVNIGKHCSVGPFAHLREGTRLADDAFIGNFIEITRSSIGPKTFAKHFSYIGDAHVGKLANIGAGTVVANFDGKEKHRTRIADNTLIGSDTVLVAPVSVGRSSVTGAGSVVTRDVPAGSVVVGVPAKVIKQKKR